MELVKKPKGWVRVSNAVDYILIGSIRVRRPAAPLIGDFLHGITQEVCRMHLEDYMIKGNPNPGDPSAGDP